MFIFGLGYTATHLASALTNSGWQVSSTGSKGTFGFDDEQAVRAALAGTDHVLSSVPPDRDSGTDPVLDRYGALLTGKWLGYLSSTGVYGDAGGAWVDEGSAVGAGRRTARAQADLAWLGRGAQVFRLPGIYGPGRSALDRVRAGHAKRIHLPDQVFSRIHVSDIVSGVVAALKSDAPPGAYNLGDDLPCSQNAVIEEACRLLDVAPPPLQAIEQANLSPMARGFYAENRRVANGKAKRVLGWQPRYRTYREGLASLI